MTRHRIALSCASILVAAAAGCGGGGDVVVCDAIDANAQNLTCVVGRPCGTFFELADDDTIEVSEGTLPAGLSLTDDGFDGALTAAGESRFKLTLTSNTSTDSDSCVPFTNTLDVIIDGREAECVDNDDCLVLSGATNDVTRDCDSNEACKGEFDFCVPYLQGGLCITQADCNGGLTAVQFTTVDGQQFEGCTFINAACGEGLCSASAQ